MTIWIGLVGRKGSTGNSGMRLTFRLAEWFNPNTPVYVFVSLPKAVINPVYLSALLVIAPLLQFDITIVLLKESDKKQPYTTCFL